MICHPAQRNGGAKLGEGWRSTPIAAGVSNATDASGGRWCQRNPTRRSAPATSDSFRTATPMNVPNILLHFGHGLLLQVGGRYRALCFLVGAHAATPFKNARTSHIKNRVRLFPSFMGLGNVGSFFARRHTVFRCTSRTYGKPLRQHARNNGPSRPVFHGSPDSRLNVTGDGGSPPDNRA